MYIAYCRSIYTIGNTGRNWGVWVGLVGVHVIPKIPLFTGLTWSHSLLNNSKSIHLFEKSYSFKVVRIEICPSLVQSYPKSVLY
jgi:hypothetical protein